MRNAKIVSLVMIVSLAILLVTGLAGCGSGAPKVDWELKISGAVNKPLTLNYSDLVKMPQTDLKDILMERSLGEDTVGSWSGVAPCSVLKGALVGSAAGEQPAYRR